MRVLSCCCANVLVCVCARRFTVWSRALPGPASQTTRMHPLTHTRASTRYRRTQLNGTRSKRGLRPASNSAGAQFKLKWAFAGQRAALGGREPPAVGVHRRRDHQDPQVQRILLPFPWMVRAWCWPAGASVGFAHTASRNRCQETVFSRHVAPEMRFSLSLCFVCGFAVEHARCVFSRSTTSSKCEAQRVRSEERMRKKQSEAEGV